MKILFIAPLPPPTHGQSLAAEVLCRRLREVHEVRVVDMAKPTALKLRDRLRRFPTVLGFLLGVAKGQRGADVIYLTISESLLGNLKDLCIYAICHRNLHRMFVHLLGGAGIKRILARPGARSRLNRFFIGRLRGVIVEGQAQATTFAALTSRDKVHVVHNFAEDFLFVTEDEIRRKFARLGTLNVLFLSNLLPGKGHHELLDAYLSLEADVRRRIRVVFVGGFESKNAERSFLDRLDGQPGLTYRGSFLGGLQKKALYNESHVFCLPTYYPYEGQPISILEAYATGCAVITTGHSGIPEVFADGLNGFLVERKSAESIKRVLEQIVKQPEGLVEIALRNRNMAQESYRTAIYESSLMKILGGVAV